MANDTDAREAIAEYEKKIRHPELERLEISPGLYALCPESDRVADVTADWSNPWPLADRAGKLERPGVYLIFNGQRQLLRVGSAWQLGPRLWQYFGGSPAACNFSGVEGDPRRPWSSPPRYVFIVAVPSNMRFEARGLEQYLIDRFKPIGNREGKQGA